MRLAHIPNSKVIMSNSLRDQLVKAGLVSKKQAHSAKQGKPRGKQAVVQKSKAQQQRSAELAALAAHKREHDRNLNAQREQQRKAREQADWVRQLIAAHAVSKQAPQDSDPAFNFKLNQAVHHIYVGARQRRLLGAGELGIVWFDGVYQIMPAAIASQLAEKIPLRVFLNPRVVEDKQAVAQDDPYADYQVPDDLIW